jgi:hypothetical protein
MMLKLDDRPLEEKDPELAAKYASMTKEELAIALQKAFEKLDK